MQRAAISNHIIPALLFLDGAFSIVFAFSAHALGIDPTPDMGLSRIAMFYFGVLIVFIAGFIFKADIASRMGEKTIIAFLLLHVWAVIIIIYVFFITFGNFTTWKASTRYYTLLADAFSKGQLHVDVEPGAALLAADDPYSSEGRPGFEDEVWDLSLYKEKLYLYWGPVPALLITPIAPYIQQPIADIYLVFFFFCGLLILNTFFILKLWRLFFADVPVRHVVLSIFLIGLILPILWSLNIPDIYEAAIGAGQFFLVGGILFAILAFEKNIQKRFLFLAGFFWACSVGSRAINVFSVIFLTALTLFWIWRHHPKRTDLGQMAQLAAALLVPLVVGATLIGWYNWARFDSPFEFGLRYQITIYNLNRYMPLTFQPDYLPFNIVAYLLLPFEFIPNFPFIQPIGFSSLLNSLNIAAPKLYAAGNVTGILFYAPFLFLAFLPFFKRNRAAQENNQLQSFTFFLLGGSFLINAVTILFYFYGQMRFMGDLVSQVTLLAILGYWLVVRNSSSSKLYLRAANVLIVFTLIVSILLAFTSESSRMERLNPDLMEKLNSLFIF